MLLPKTGESIKGVKVLRPEFSRAEMERKVEEVRSQYAQEILELKQGALKGMDEGYKDMVKAVNQRLPDLVMALVKRVWGDIELDRGHLEGIVDEVLTKNAPDGEVLEIYLCLEDYALLMEGSEAFTDKYPDVVVKKDSKLKRGDCLVRSKFGLVDATIDTKLKQIRQELG